MRAHTALHILCGVIWRDYCAPVTGAQIDVGQARMDFELDRMSADFAAEIERRRMRRSWPRARSGFEPAARRGVCDPRPDSHQGQSAATGDRRGSHR